MADKWEAVPDAMKIVFLGTADFALPSLEGLVAAGHRVAAAVTQPDRPAGRGRRLGEPPVKRRAGELGIPVRQPESLSSAPEIAHIAALAPDLVVSAAYGRLIPASYLASAVRGGINLHPSLLPRWRGAAPIAWALIAGDRETGVTVHRLVERLDAGEIFAQERFPIEEGDDGLSLAHRLARAGARILCSAVSGIEALRAAPYPQDDSRATLAPKLAKEDGRIDWRKRAEEIHNRVRGLIPWPGAFTHLERAGERRLLKVHATRVVPAGSGAPGTVLAASGEDLVVAAGEGALRILRLQAEGGKALAAGEFLRGFRLEPGERLGKAV